MYPNNRNIYFTLFVFILLWGCASNTKYADTASLEGNADDSVQREQVKVFESYNYYYIEAYRRRELISTLINSSPIQRNGDGYLGETHTYYKWTIDWLSDSSSCWVNKAQIELHVNFTLPKLKASSPAVRTIWDEWYPKLLRHEHNHRDIAMYTADKMLSSLSELAPANSCEDLLKSARDIVSKYEEEEELLHDKYDIETNHGETEGLIFEI